MGWGAQTSLGVWPTYIVFVCVCVFSVCVCMRGGGGVAPLQQADAHCHLSPSSCACCKSPHRVPCVWPIAVAYTPASHSTSTHTHYTIQAVVQQCLSKASAFCLSGGQNVAGFCWCGVVVCGLRAFNPSIEWERPYCTDNDSRHHAYRRTDGRTDITHSLETAIYGKGGG